jgi:hypothetical protein
LLRIEIGRKVKGLRGLVEAEYVNRLSGDKKNHRVMFIVKRRIKFNYKMEFIRSFAKDFRKEADRYGKTN